MSTEKPRRILELNAASWASVVDFYSAVIVAVGGAEDAMTNLDGLLEYLIWGMGNVEPPYTIRIRNSSSVPNALMVEIELFKSFLWEDQDGVRLELA